MCWVYTALPTPQAHRFGVFGIRQTRLIFLQIVQQLCLAPEPRRKIKFMFERFIIGDHDQRLRSKFRGDHILDGDAATAQDAIFDQRPLIPRILNQRDQRLSPASFRIPKRGRLHAECIFDDFTMQFNLSRVVPIVARIGNVLGVCRTENLKLSVFDSVADHFQRFRVKPLQRADQCSRNMNIEFCRRT